MFDKYEDRMLIYNLLDDLEECFHLKSLLIILVLHYIFVLRFNRICKQPCFMSEEKQNNNFKKNERDFNLVLGKRETCRSRIGNRYHKYLRKVIMHVL